MDHIYHAIAASDGLTALSIVCFFLLCLASLRAMVAITRGPAAVSKADDRESDNTITVSHYISDGGLIAESETETFFSALAFALATRNFAIKNGHRHEMREDEDGNLVLTVTGETGGQISKTIFSHEDEPLTDLEQLYKNYRE